MSRRDRRLGPWTGETTPRRWRFLVVARYARRDIFASRLVTAFFALAFAPLVAAAIYIYLRYNLSLLAELGLPREVLPAADANFFYQGLRVQGFFAFLLAVLVGPGLVAPDLANNALPLYLARPLRRGEYLAGKLAVLAALLSVMSWLPLGLLVLLEAGFADAAGLAGHGRDLAAVVLGGLVWVLVVALAALAVSAWVRWKMLAAAVLAAAFFVARALAAVVEDLFGSRWAELLDPASMIDRVWQGLLWGAPESGPPLAGSWLGLAAVVALCLALLDRRLRACEVVR